MGVFGGLACTPPGTPVAVGDGPGSGPAAIYVNAIALRSANPVRSGQARLAFRLAATERVEVRIFDVSGRMVRRVADRLFAAGEEHVVIWDGADDSGRKVRPGVFFYQVRTPSYVGQKKLTVLN